MATQKIYTPEEAQKKFDTLPAEIKNLLYSTEMLTTIRKIGEKNQLHIDQIGILQAETSSVMMGLTETRDYVEVLMEELKIDKTKADALAKDVNDLLFIKIRESMKIEPASISGKSVVMPSAVKESPAATPVTPAAAPSVPEIIKPAAMPMMQHIDTMLTQPTVSIAPKPAEPTQKVPSIPAPTEAPKPDITKAEAPKPGPIYKTDPYHEPID